jgi:hypothetical protein
MRRKDYQAAFPAALAVVMVTFLSTVFFANPTLSLAAADGKKSSAVASASAVDHTEARIKQLHSALKITKGQQELWINLTQVMRGNAKDMDALIKESAGNTKTMNAVEHMKFHSQITEAQLDQSKKFIPPFEALYLSMSDEQQKSTDRIFRTGVYGNSKKK